MSEVIERDMNVRFWLGKLPPLTDATDAVRTLLENGHAAVSPRAWTLPIVLPGGGDAHWVIAATVADAAPYLSVGTSVDTQFGEACRTALNEMIGGRAHQYDCLLSYWPGYNPKGFERHMWESCAKPHAGNRFGSIVAAGAARSRNTEGDYSGRSTWVANVLPLPSWVEMGTVSKAWISGCIPLPADGDDYEVPPADAVFSGIARDEFGQIYGHPYQ